MYFVRIVERGNCLVLSPYLTSTCHQQDRSFMIFPKTEKPLICLHGATGFVRASVWPSVRSMRYCHKIMPLIMFLKSDGFTLRRYLRESYQIYGSSSVIDQWNFRKWVKFDSRWIEIYLLRLQWILFYQEWSFNLSFLLACTVVDFWIRMMIVSEYRDQCVEHLKVFVNDCIRQYYYLLFREG